MSILDIILYTVGGFAMGMLILIPIFMIGVRLIPLNPQILCAERYVLIARPFFFARLGPGKTIERRITIDMGKHRLTYTVKT